MSDFKSSNFQNEPAIDIFEAKMKFLSAKERQSFPSAILTVLHCQHKLPSVVEYISNMEEILVSNMQF